MEEIIRSKIEQYLRDRGMHEAATHLDGIVAFVMSAMPLSIPGNMKNIIGQRTLEISTRAVAGEISFYGEMLGDTADGQEVKVYFFPVHKE